MNIPKLTEKEIEERVGSKSFEKGKRYFKNDAVFDARRVGMTMKASCEGSYEASYRLWIKFIQKGISDGQCSCPVGDGGFCKHISAMLLTWIYHPDEFIEVPDINEVLIMTELLHPS